MHDTTFSDMLTVLAVSSVVHRPVQTLWPIIANPRVESPMTKLVIGRQNQSTRNPIYILWTTTSYISGQQVTLNHFVPLIEHVSPIKTNVIMIDESPACSVSPQVLQTLTI